MIEQLLAVTMGAADTMMVSSVGEVAISGVNIVDNINNLLIIAFIALCTGGSVVTSQYIGRRERDNAGLASKQLIYIVTLVSLAVTGIAIILRRPIVSLLYGNIADEVMNAADIYFLITAMSYPFLAVYNADAALFRASGNSRTPMRVAVLVNILNIGGNAFFIFGLRIGVAGAALSTLISRIAAAVILTRLLIRSGGHAMNLSGILKIRLCRSMIRRILNVGIPSGLESSMFQIGRLLTQRIFTTFGTSAIAGNAIAGVINSFSFMPGMAYGMALLTIVGQCVGAGDYDSAKKQTKKIMILAYITIITSSSLNFIFMEPLVSLFQLSPEAHGIAKAFLQVHCISMAIGWPMSFALPNALRAAGDARYVMLVASISMWIVRVSAAYLLSYPLGVGPLGVWIAMGADFISRGSFYFGRWCRNRWQTKTVI
ncbi:MAG: MATE family efflux transporter [Spirochaetaceae bacterium]|nr:MATE family efflux transporter [Spirochaetaceae bacterium]